MIIVIGSVTVRADALAEALKLSQEHVERSRQEPGCISHGVNVDNEDPNRLVFIERWQDMEHLEQHFRVPESGEFVQQMAALATVAPTMDLYQSNVIQRH
ncbi:MAG: putative quinol monooxygenase [Gammaproteobacteria bacterium]|nr:putative quinol monooxygenase [Gammaproteobacteria bacterium]MDD9894280.1 putative quinol monooxygenase [Gammaproteobacteria bacterium]MDD9960417.1 putative quinol monooxygenase [Gammaproteobacteria bacterium]